MHNLLFVLALFILISCSSEKPVEVSNKKPSEAGYRDVPESNKKSTQDHASLNTELFSLGIAPADASRSSTLYVVPRGFNLSDAEIEWLLNGQQADTSIASQFNAAVAQKGDKIQARAIIQGNEILSNVVELKNALPEVTEVKMTPEVFRPGDTIGFDVVSSDMDGDEVTLSYEWTMNGKPAGSGKQIGVPLKRGDRFTVKITPFDGQDYGRPYVMRRDMGNMPPVIIEDKKFSFDGEFYTYQVMASDPDEDSLTFSLKSAPEGMSIDSKTGMITWTVPQDFKGKASITVSVTDGSGGEATQDLTLTINPPPQPQ